MNVDDAPQRLRTLPSWLIGQLAVQARHAVDAELEPLGVRRSQYSLLASVEQFGPSSQVELSERSGLDRSDVVRWVDDLVGRGWLRRAPDPQDRRRNVISITARGRTTLRALDTRVSNAQRSLLATLSDAQQEQLIRLLRKALALG